MYLNNISNSFMENYLRTNTYTRQVFNKILLQILWQSQTVKLFNYHR